MEIFSIPLLSFGSDVNSGEYEKRDSPNPKYPSEAS